MPRKTLEPYVQWKISVPATLAARIENLHFDPTHQKPKYAERSRLICDLLQQYLASRSPIGVSFDAQSN